MSVTLAPWWVRPGLEARDGRLTIAGEDAEALARQHGTPLFVYDRTRFAENARRLAAALDRAGLRHRLRFALKSHPDPRVLEVLRGLVGIDACSPGEVTRALECGFAPEDISFTGTNVSERDLDVLLAAPIHINLDAISQVERLGRRDPGRTIGLRINPAAGAGYHTGLAYSGERPTKFGIYEERIPDALAAPPATASRSTRSTSMPDRAGSGPTAWPRSRPRSRRVAAIAARLIADGHPIVEVNVGGGLGVPARSTRSAGRPRRLRRGPRAAISGRSAWPSAASPATTSQRMPRSSSARS